MWDKVKNFVMTNKSEIASYVFWMTVGGVAGWYGTKYVWNVASITEINKLLSAGTIQWADGMPVYNKVGELVSGNPDWVCPPKDVVRLINI